jgi:hypothetical protein
MVCALAYEISKTVTLPLLLRLWHTCSWNLLAAFRFILGNRQWRYGKETWAKAEKWSAKFWI